MAQTVQLQIEAAVSALLAAAPALADGGVTDDENRPMAEQHACQLHVFWDTSLPEIADLSGQPTDWMTRIRIEVQARSVAGTSAKAKANDVAQAVYARVMADASLAGLCWDAIPRGLQSVPGDSETALRKVQVVFDFKHRTPFNSITA